MRLHRHLERYFTRVNFDKINKTFEFKSLIFKYKILDHKYYMRIFKKGIETEHISTIVLLPKGKHIKDYHYQKVIKGIIYLCTFIVVSKNEQSTSVICVKKK